MFQLQFQQSALQPFDAQSQCSGLQSGNPLAQSLSQLRPTQFNLTQQSLRLANMPNAAHQQAQLDVESPGGLFLAHQPAASVHSTGHQYEVLLRERGELSENVKELQRVLEGYKKQVNQIKGE